MNDRSRNIIHQGVALLLVAAVVGYLGTNLVSNLNRTGMGFGIGFLTNPAGFDLSFKLTGFTSNSTYLYAFWTGLLNTVLASAISILLATIIGMIVGVARWSRLPLIGDLATIYVELFRNIPLLLQLFFWYFFALRSLPDVRDSLSLADAFFLNSRGLYMPAISTNGYAATVLFAGTSLLVVSAFTFRTARKVRIEVGRQPAWRIWAWVALAGAAIASAVFIVSIGWQLPVRTKFSMRGGITIVPELVALIGALSIYFGSYAAECVRAGLSGVSRGQQEAAAALGLSFLHTVRLVLLPQAVRTIVPPLANVYLTLIKASALGSAIAYPEILQVANTTLNQTGQALNVSVILISAFLLINLSVAAAMNWFEMRYKIVTNHD